MAMMAMTTSSSINVKAFRGLEAADRFACPFINGPGNLEPNINLASEDGKDFVGWAVYPREF
jgi:hypothetical protein